MFDPDNPHRVRFKRDISAISGYATINQQGEEYDNYEVAQMYKKDGRTYTASQ